MLWYELYTIVLQASYECAELIPTKAAKYFLSINFLSFWCMVPEPCERYHHDNLGIVNKYKIYEQTQRLVRYLENMHCLIIL